LEDLEGGIETAMQAGVRKDHELSLGGFFPVMFFILILCFYLAT